MNKKVLGRGLSDLFADRMSLISNDINMDDNKNGQQQGLLYLDIMLIKPCSTQPRTIFDQDLLGELASSIKDHGVIQPIIVKQKNNDGYYEIVAGERRWRASIIAGQKKIPSMVKNLDDHSAFLLSVIENLQRADLSAIEEAEVYQRLVNNGFTHEQIATMLNKSRSYISNIIRLNNLTQNLKDLVNTKVLSLGHAKILVMNTNQDELAEHIIKKGMNIRQAEEFIKKSNNKNLTISEQNIDQRLENNQNNHLKELEELLSQSMETKVTILDNRITINYSNITELDRLLELLIK